MRTLFEGWFDFTGKRDRWNYFGVLIFQIIAILIIGTVLSMFVIMNLAVMTIGYMALAAAVLWMTASVTTQRLRHCGMTTSWKLAATNVVAYLTVIPYLFIMFWPPAR